MVAIATMATGCFTGVESTPKITANDVKKQKVAPTPEQLLLQDIREEAFDSWQPGKTFYVTDDKLDMALVPEIAASKPHMGDILRYRGASTVGTLTADTAVEVVVELPDGTPRRYRARRPSAGQALTIPFTIPMSVVAETANRLDTHRQLYITTSQWYHPDGEARRGLRYVPVTVLSVTPGTHVYPVRVTFAHEADTACVMMNVGGIGGAQRTFDTLFSLDDPHRRYPAITDNRWKEIIQGQLRLGMTRDEARLAIGAAPPMLDRYPTNDGVVEIWQYDDGTYLKFNGDGLLESLWR